MRRSSISLRALIVGLAAGAPSAAFAANGCVNVVAGEHAFVGTGENCVAPAGTYSPTATSGILPFTDPGYGFVAYGNGQLSTAGAVTITPPNATGASAVLSTGAGSAITLTNGATLTTSGATARAVQADAGGLVTLGGARVANTVTTTGNSGYGLFATGANSQITASGIGVMTSGGGQAIGVYAYDGGAVTLGPNGLGQSAQVKTTGNSADAVVAGAGGLVTINGGAVTTTGLGSGGLVVVDTGSSLTATNVKVTTTGAIDTSSGYYPDAIYNGPAPGGTSGGTAKLTDVTASTAGAGVFTVSTGAGGITTFLGGSIASTGANAGGVISFKGGSTTVGLDPGGMGTTITTTGVNASGARADTGGNVSLHGGSATTSGAGALGLYATGANSVVSATNVAVSTTGGNFANALLADTGGTVITNGGSAATTGADVYVALATAGGALKLKGTTLTATGLGAGGIGLNGSTTSLTGVNLTIVTHGDFDAANDFGAAGVTNQGAGQNTGGGVVSLTNSTIATTGSQAVGAANLNSGAMTIIGGAITTSGVQSFGVFTASGASTNLTGVQITTSGDGAKALSVIGAGTTLSGSNLTVSTSGAVAGADSQANALYNGNGNGSGSGGGSTGGGTVALTGSALSTSGDHAHAAVTENGGSTTLTKGSVTTSGRQSDAVFGSSGGSITLVSERLTTSGDASKGIDIEGAGTRLTGSGLTIATSGTVDAATGFHAQGVYNGASTPATAGQTGGGIVTLTSSSVTTSGVNSYGVDTANGGSTTFVGGSISTSGSGAIALLATDGASVTVQKGAALVLAPSFATTNSAISGGSVSITGATTTVALAGPATTLATTGVSAAAVAANSGASVSITGATITTGGAGSAGVTLRDAGTLVTLTSVSIATSGGVDIATGDHASAVYNGPGATGSSGGTLTLANVLATTSGAQAYGLLTDSGSHTSATGGGFATSGADSAAVLALNASQMQLSGVALSTTGDGASGLVMNGAGGNVSAANLTITTAGGVSTATGSHADGVYNGAFGSFAGGGTLKLTDSTVTTSGDEANGVSVGAGGTTTFLGGAVTTSSDGATGLRVEGGSLTVGADALGHVTVVTTSGADASGAVAQGGGVLSLMGTRIATTGLGAWGLYVSDAASRLSATGVAVTTTGGVDATGNVSLGAYAQNGAIMTLTNTTIATQGAGAHGAEAGGASSINISGGSVTTGGPNAYGLFATDANSAIVATNGVSVSTGGLESDGVFALSGASVNLTGGSVATTGNGAAALLASGAGSKLTATGVAISTGGDVDTATGNQAQGVAALSGAVATLTNDTIATTGLQGHGVLAVTGGQVVISGGSVTVSGTDADGLLANGAGSTIATSGGLVVTSTATPSSFTIAGARADNGGALNLSATTISTSGAGVSGVGVESGGSASLDGVIVTTRGDGAHALTVTGAGSTATLSGDNMLKTTGDGAIGVFAGAGGVVTATGSASITTTGTNALSTGFSSFGVNADGAGASITLAAANIATSGQGAVGLLASDRNATGSGGAITVNGALTVTTQASFSYDAFASGAGSKIALNGATTLNVGAGSFGLYATGGGAISTAGNLTINAANAGFGGGVEADSGSSIALGGPSAINLTSTHLVGVFAAGGAITSTAALTVNAGANAGVVAQNGGVFTASGGLDISTTGAGAHGLYVSGAGSGAALAGAVTINVSGAGAAGIYVDSGGAVGAKGPLTVNAATYGLYINGYAAGPTTLGLGGALTLKTTDPSGAAITLAGDNTTFSGAGGGVIDAAGPAVAFLDGVQQSATFVGYQINAPEILYADPASATVSFDNTTANAGTGDLAHVVGGSELTLTALASSLTGVIQTEAGSLSNVTLAGGSTWTITGNSTVTNLSLVNASAGFAPTTGGPFHTLTVTNFTGQGASLTLNAALGGTNPGADKLVIDGGRATGATTINIRSIGNIGAAIGGVSVPIVLTTNGGSIASGAFALSGPVTVGGYTYALQSESDGEFLVSSQALSGAQASSSLSSLAQSRQSQAITSRVLTSILTGATEQINCSSCSSGFASFGSFAIGAHGRWSLSPSLALLAGASYDSYSAKGVTVNNSLEAAIGLRYDMVQLGKYRPFFEAGVAVSPYANVSFNRGYASSAGAGAGVGDTLSRAVSAYGRAGYIWRLTPKDEAAAYGSFTRSWQSTGGYLEGATAGNPFGALVLPSLDSMNIAEIGAQYTHLFGQHIEANVSAGYAFAFDANYGSDATISGFGPASGVAATSFSWAEWGGRLSYRFSKNVIADAFVLGTLGAEPAGNQIHGGLALRMAF